jgi:hypothetical protein
LLSSSRKMSRRSENGAEFSTPYAFCSLLAGSYK